MTSDKDAILAELENGVKGLQQEVAVEAARKALAAGMNPVEAIENGLAKAVVVIDAPGLGPADLSTISYQNAPVADLYPLGKK